MAADTERIDGEAIAREHIAREATERTGSLDLGRLGLTALPEELFALKHLRRLNLGRTSFLGDWRSWRESSTDSAPHDIESSLDRLIKLSELEILSVSGCKLASLDGIAGLKWLRILNCSYTKVSDLAPLSGLTALQTLNCSSSTQVRDLAPLAGLPALQTLYCYNPRCAILPRWRGSPRSRSFIAPSPRCAI